MIDLVNDGKVYRFGQRGEGENEFLQVFSFCSMDVDSLVGVYDVYRRCLCGINLRQVKREPAKFPIKAKDTIDFPATKFCVSDNDNVLYALVNKGETELVQYALK